MLKMKKKRFRFGIQRVTKFNGKRKVGIDANVLIRIYEQPFLLENDAFRIFKSGDIIFTHAICLYEIIKKLKKKGFNEQEAKVKAKFFLKENNINIIYPNNCYIPPEEIKKFEDDCNKKFKEENKDDLKCHCPDSIIILAFYKSNINKIYSTDKSFRESSKLKGIDSNNFPTFNYAINREIRKLYNYKKWKR